jgi:hypothetical protein
MGPGAEVGVAAWPPTVEGVNAWLWGPEGRSRVRYAIDRYRLPVALADDLAQEVLYRAWRAIGRGEAIVSVPAFATTLLSRAAVDLLWGRSRRGEDLEPGADAEPGHPGSPAHTGSPADPSDPADPGAGAPADPSATGADPVGDAVALALDPPLADGMRRSIHGLLGPRPAAGAAALAYVTLVADEVPPPTGCPIPEGGVDPEEGLAWAALWCTGRDDCFDVRPGRMGAGGAGAPAAAIRARRSRALRAMRALLAQAANGLPEDDRA